MRRSLLCALGLASVVLSLGLVGCGTAGVEAGMPKDPTKVDHPLTPDMVDQCENSEPR
jgi:hypothetical protein